MSTNNPVFATSLLVAVGLHPAFAQDWRMQLPDASLLDQAERIELTLYDGRDSTTALAHDLYLSGEWSWNGSDLTLPELNAGVRQDDLWAELLIDGIALEQRLPIRAVSTGVTLATGQYLDMGGNNIGNLADPSAAQDAATRRYVDTQIASAPAGDITSVVAGNGLSGGGDTGDVTLAIDSNLVQNRVSGSCPSGEAIRVIAADGTVTCEVDDDSIAPPAWQLGGNDLTGTEVLGSNNAQPVTLQVDGRRALQLIPATSITADQAPNILLGGDTNTIYNNIDGPAINGVTIGGGFQNQVKGTRATIGGGTYNTADGFASTVAGGNSNNATGNYSSIAGGSSNIASDLQSSIGGGDNNIANGLQARISGGSGNTASGIASTVSGGRNNQATGYITTIGGGTDNQASKGYAVIAGGARNIADGDSASISGGIDNQANGDYAVVPGGRDNQADGNYSLAAGRRAKVRGPVITGDADGDEGTFVWADSTNADFISTGPDQFLIRASGGVGIGTNAPKMPLHLEGQSSSSGVTRLVNTSTGSSADVLHLFLGASNPGTNNEFLIFWADGLSTPATAVGSIQGTGAGGVQLKSGGADFAEYLPSAHSDLQPGEVVALRAGRLWRDTRDAERLLVVSSAPIISGNSDMQGDQGKALVAFIGQVPVHVSGPVRAGDWLIASGRHDGKARAVRADAMDTEDWRTLIGRSLETARNGRVRALVGLPAHELLARQQQQNRTLRQQIAVLRQQVRNTTALRQRITRLEALLLTEQGLMPSRYEYRETMRQTEPGLPK